MPASIGLEKLRRLTSRGISRVENVWYGRSAGNIVVRAALWPLAKAYDVAVSTRTRLYDSGVWPVQAAALPTISVGNLTVGGTGKTPFAAFLAERLQRQARPAIALRGYGNDETEVHRRLNPGVPVIANADRAAAILEARARGADVVVLDDAFQHRRVGRNADVVLLSVEQLQRPRRLLPAGPWREHLSAARRADLLVITRKSATREEALAAAATVQAEVPDVPIAHAHLAPRELVTVTGAETMGLDRLRGVQVVAIAGIGEPELFKAQLESCGALVALQSFRDHHDYSDADVAQLAARVPVGGLAICTLKDAVKLAGRWPGPNKLWYVSQQLEVDQGGEEIDRLLQRVIAGRAAAATTAE